MRRAAVFLLGLTQCSGGPTATPVHEERPAAVSPAGLSAAEVWAAADARSSVDLLAGLDSPLAEDRERATLALARLHDPAVRSLLLLRLRDPSPSVRAAAGLGLGALGRDEATEAALIGALAAETDPARRAELLWDLGRAGSASVLPTLEAALAEGGAAERAAACHAAAQLALDHVRLGAAFVERLARTAGGVDVAVQLACAHAIVRAEPTPGLVPALSGLARDPDPEVRGMGLRALGRAPDVSISDLQTALLDPDWDVALLAMRALVAHAELPEADQVAARALTTLHGRALAAPSAPRALPAMIGVLEAIPHGLARTRAVAAAASTIHGSGAAAVGDEGLAQLDCAVARLVDLGRGWPRLVEECGGEHVSSSERARLAAEILGSVTGAELERTRALERLLASATPLVREAVASALASMDEPSGRALLLRLAADDDLGVVVSAVDALARRIERAVQAHEAASLMAVLEGSTPAAIAWPDAATMSALRSAAERFREADDLEGLVTVLGAIATSREPSLGDVAEGLAWHHSLAVRDAARSALEPLDLAVPEGVPNPPPNPIAADALTTTEPVVVEVETRHGTFAIQLRPDWAPTTVARFLALVDEGFYDGLAFHRVVPAFVVQGGDPRGDGYGGPGWSQRCEDNRVPYERGTVGMALAGRDTGGSQFFVALTPQPHLDGRYTAFGRILEGMEVVERLLRGDVMIDVRRR